MNSDAFLKQTTRREVLRGSAALAGGAFLAQLFPGSLLRAGVPGHPQLPTPSAERTAGFRAQFGAVPIQSQKLTDNLTLLSGPGGNVVVSTGPDGKLLVDNFVAPAWPKLKDALDGLGMLPSNSPLTRIGISTTPTITVPSAPQALPFSPTKTQKSACPPRKTFPFSACISIPRPPTLCLNKHSPTATSCNSMAKL